MEQKTKKVCSNCKNFSEFFTKIGITYIMTDCGRCWATKKITGNQETCNKWEIKNADEKLEKIYLLKALDTALSQINAIKEALIKN